MWLLAGQKAPDHSTIARFRSGFLEEICRERNTEFVHSRGKRKSIEQRYLELFQRYLEHQTTYDWHTASFQGRNNYCKTDPYATFMHMKDDYMRNAQLKPGGNAPSVTADSGYESEEGYSYLREEGQQPYIKPQTYKTWRKEEF